MRTIILAIISALLLTAICVVPSAPVESAQRSSGMSADQKAEMKKCNDNSADCNHRCDFMRGSGSLTKSGLSHCQDKCDTKFANCVGNVGPD